MKKSHFKKYNKISNPCVISCYILNYWNCRISLTLAKTFHIWTRGPKNSWSWKWILVSKYEILRDKSWATRNIFGATMLVGLPRSHTDRHRDKLLIVRCSCLPLNTWTKETYLLQTMVGGFAMVTSHLWIYIVSIWNCQKACVFKT